MSAEPLPKLVSLTHLLCDLPPYGCAIEDRLPWDGEWFYSWDGKRWVVGGDGHIRAFAQKD